jgi:hypothetical protein
VINDVMTKATDCDQNAWPRNSRLRHEIWSSSLGRKLASSARQRGPDNSTRCCEHSPPLMKT